MQELNNYKYKGARACVILHEKHMRECLKVWKQAKAANIQLPATTDKDYQSLETLLKHILGAARGYMVWMCKQLDLPDPEIKPAPDIDTIEAQADSYLEHVLERWPLALADIAEEKFGPHSYTSNWGEAFSIDSMLEHAVMHPIRHEFQLRSLMQMQGKG
jgi:uncharacterized damage-inducible protein DinB